MATRDKTPLGSDAIQTIYFHLSVLYLCSTNHFLVFVLITKYKSPNHFFLPFIIIRYCTTKGKYLNYKNPKETFGTGWIHTIERTNLKR